MDDSGPSAVFAQLAAQPSGPAIDLSALQPQMQFNPEEARSVYVRGYGVTDAGDSHPVLTSSGAGPCLIVAAYNPATRTGALAHLDTNTDTRSVNQMLDRLGGGPLQVHLAGGWEISRHLVESTLDVLDARSDVQIKSSEVINNFGTLKAMALDTRTGEVSGDYNRYGVTRHPQLDAIIANHGATAASFMPLRLEYDHGDIPFRPAGIKPAAGMQP